MSAIKSYSSIRIEVRPSPETNSHEVRFIADGEDLIDTYWNDMIGLDPDDILVKPCQLSSDAKPHKVTVARCSCGEIGCGSVEVEVVRCGKNVEWTWATPSSPQKLMFLATKYDAEVKRALSDTSWETPDRTAARLLAGKVDRAILAERGITYSWASGRCRKETLTVSLNVQHGPYQILVQIPWKRESPEQIAQQTARLLSDDPATWTQVEWLPQKPGLGPPAFAGPTWQRFSS